MLKFKTGVDKLPKTARTFVKRPIKVKAEKIYTEFEVETLEGTLQGKIGDWLIEGVKGELYPCDKEIFGLTYEEV